MLKQTLLGALVAVAITTTALAQSYQMATPFAPGVAVPDKIESSIGTLNLNYGYPSADTCSKIYLQPGSFRGASSLFAGNPDGQSGRACAIRYGSLGPITRPT